MATCRNLISLLASIAVGISAIAATARVHADAAAATPPTPEPASSSAATLPGPIVSVTGGRIRGTLLPKGGAAFKGIPYAQPPVGDLRWREPTPIKPWNGVRDATAFGAICPQAPYFIPNAAEIAKEDCLYLNVWTSEWPSNTTKAVMVWIHGGGNFAGGIVAGGREGPEESLARHGVVVVSLNYRLGSFGFFSYPALTRESPHHASGNQGLLDQVAALEWVQANISKFGGDPRNVTIFGESAGSIDASVLMTTRLSQGLFERVIGESGSVATQTNYYSVAEAERRGAKQAARWNAAAAGSLEQLRAVPMADILKSDPDYQAGEGARGVPGMVVDGYFLSMSPLEVFAEGSEYRVALLHGSNSWDFAGLTQRKLSAVIRDAYGPLAERAIPLYGEQTDPLYGTPTLQWFADTTFRCPAVAQLLWHTAAGNDSYEYEFTHVPPGAKAPGVVDPDFVALVGMSDIGAVHSSEVSYVFGALSKGVDVFYAQQPIPAAPVDFQVAAAMQEYWTNFAKTGDPNGGRLPKWPKFTASRRAYLEFASAGPAVKEGLRRAQCDLYVENLRRVMPK
jgi:para-nitrobenzyl esterase